MVNTPSQPNPGITGVPAQVTVTTTNPQPVAVAPKLKILSQWAHTGLNLSNAGFSKLQAKEAAFDSSKTKYNLEPEKFETYKQDLIEKVNRMHYKHIFFLQ